MYEKKKTNTFVCVWRGRPPVYECCIYMFPVKHIPSQVHPWYVPSKHIPLPSPSICSTSQQTPAKTDYLTQNHRVPRVCRVQHRLACSALPYCSALPRLSCTRTTKGNESESSRTSLLYSWGPQLNLLIFYFKAQSGILKKVITQLLISGIYVLSGF